MKKLITVFFVLIIAVTAITGCSSSSASKNYGLSVSQAAATPAPAAAATDFTAGLGGGFTNSMRDSAVTEEAAYDAEAPAAMPVSPEKTGGGAMDNPATAGGPAVNKALSNQKIIRYVDISLQTLTFDTGVAGIPKLVESYGGYVQDSYIEGRDMYNERGVRFARFTVRVPSEKLDEFVGSLGGEFNVINKSENSENITETYYDTQARLNSLKIQEERLLAMLETAAELEYLLQVQEKLANVQYEIDSLTSSLSRMDNYVSLSTVNIGLNEVVKYEHIEDVPSSFSERISRAFSSSLEGFARFSQDFTVGLVLMLPYLLVLAVIAVIIILIIRRHIRKRSERKELRNTQAAVIQQNTQQPAKESEKSDKNE